MNARILVVDDSPTIRRVVASILAKRTYEPLLAGDGVQALDVLGSEKVDLVLLDFVMPRMNGYQFCRELRKSPELKSLPVVLMSAKGDKIREQFVQQTGAIDAITKPFDARGLIAAIEGALKKHGEGRGRPVPDAAAMPEEDESAFDSSRAVHTGSSEDLGARRLLAAQELGAALTRLVKPELALLPGFSGEALESVTQALKRAINPDSIGTLASLLKGRHFGDVPREVLAGDVSVISIAEVLQLLDLQRQSGTLSVFTREHEITLYVRDGVLDLAGSRGLHEEFRVGTQLVEDGVTSRAQLQSVLAGRTGSRQLLGEHLIELGIATAQQVNRALFRQTSALVYEVVRWRKGRFAFTLGAENLAAGKAALGIETSALVMEGFRRVDEWRLIEGSLDFDQVLYRDPVAIERLGENANLTSKERAVLDVIDGERTIREIVDLAGGSSFEVCKILYQCLNSRLVRCKAA